MTRQNSLWFDQAMLPTGWATRVQITVVDGQISSIKTDADPHESDERHGIALPGMPNVHSHAFQRGMAGLAERRGPATDNFWTWREVMYHFVSRIRPVEFEAIAALAYMEMLESGFTHVGEFHYLHRPSNEHRGSPQGMLYAACAAASTAGIGLTLLPSFYAHSDCGGKPPLQGQQPFLLSIDEYAALVEQSRIAVKTLPGSVVGIAPHSLRAVAPNELAEILPLAGDGPIHIHASEQTGEVDACIKWSGQRPVEWLLDHMPLNEKWCLIHATHMTPDESARLARTGAVVGLCPVTEANLGDGIFATADYWGTGQIAVGTDSNVMIGVAEELRMLEYAQRLHSRTRNVLCLRQGSSNGGDLYRATLQGGTQALGVQGGLRIGASADFISLQQGHPSMVSRTGDSLIDSFLFSSSRSAIDCVWRAGGKVVRDGLHIDRTRIVEQYNSVMARMV